MMRLPPSFPPRPVPLAPPGNPTGLMAPMPFEGGMPRPMPKPIAQPVAAPVAPAAPMMDPRQRVATALMRRGSRPY